MFLHTQLLINEIAVDEPDPAAANALQEGLGRPVRRDAHDDAVLFQSFNFRGDSTAKPCKDLLYGIGTEEIGHVELIATTISQLLDGSPAYQGKKKDPVDKPGAKGATPLSIALESTGRLQKCRIYEMTGNKTAHSTTAYLIVRDQAHENAYAKALESLGVNWGATLPIPKTSAERFPEVKKLLDQGLQSLQYTFSADDKSEAAKLFRGASPSGDGTELTTAVMPEGSPMTIAPERREEFSPGLDPELLALIQATAEVEISAAGKPSS